MMYEQSEFSNSPQDVDLGSVRLAYNPRQCEISLNQFELNQDNNYVELSDAHFSRNIAPHIIHACFTLTRNDNDQYVHKGVVVYDQQKVFGINTKMPPARILRFLQKHINSFIQFAHHSSSIDNDRQLLTVMDSMTNLTIKVHKNDLDSHTGNITFSIEDTFALDTLAVGKTLDAAILWGIVCDFVVRQHYGHRYMSEQDSTLITISQLQNAPTDLEFAILMEIEKRRRDLGTAALLPVFSSSDTLSEESQDFISSFDLTFVEQEELAKFLINQKRVSYGESGIMQPITKKDIFRALSHIIETRLNS